MKLPLSNYSFEDNKIRTTLKNAEIWFIAEDICNALNLTNVTMALKPLDDDERSKFNLGRQGEVNIVSESGMYTLILRCRDGVKKGTAPYRFKKWVTREVLPTIRKTGSYSLTINSEQQQLIKQAVNQRSYRTGEHRQAIYSKFYEYFKVPKYQDLPANKFDDAIKWLGGVKIKSAQFTDDELCRLAWCYKAGETMRIHIESITDALFQMKSDLAPTFFSMGNEYKRTLERARKIIDRETKHIEHNHIDMSWNRVLPNIRLAIR